MNLQKLSLPETSTKSLNALRLYVVTSLLVLFLMMLAGATMRYTQGALIEVAPNLFYQLLTVHGAGMVGIAGLFSSAVMWYFLRRYVDLSTNIFLVNFVLFLIGVLMIIGSIFLGDFAAAWTFLYPLPAKSMGVWSHHAAAMFLGGLLIIGVGFLLFYLDVTRAILKRYSNLYNAMGLQYLFGGKTLDEDHPPAVVASTMVLIINTLGILAGAVILVMCILNLYFPDDVAIDPLLAKNLTYFFGHVFINASIYMAVIAVYELLPKYTNRLWKVNKLFITAWFFSTFMVMLVYPHHLLMDFAMPRWAMVVGQICSYMNGFPVLLVTAYGAVTLVHRSGIKWDLISRLLFLSMFGWVAGTIPAIIDATISVNVVMHNTMWVPGHFHFYLLLGLLPMLFAFSLFVTQTKNERNTRYLDEIFFSSYLYGSLVLIGTFLLSGKDSVPRRWAVHYAEWISMSQIAAVGATMVVLGTLFFLIKIILRINKASLTADA